MREIRDHLYIGSNRACRDGTSQRAVVHACKRPCYQGAIGREGTLPHDHPDHHAIAESHDLYLNLRDRMQPRFSMEVFEAFFRFTVQQWAAERELLLHCNAGRSRSPSLGLLFLAGITEDIPNDTFIQAANAYAALDPKARPGPGLRYYLRDHWGALMDRAEEARPS